MENIEFYAKCPVANSAVLFAVVVPRYQGRWILRKNKYGWDFPWAFRQEDETPADAAMRALNGYVLDSSSLRQVGCIGIKKDNSTLYGGFFFAEVIETVPEADCLFQKLPSELPHPAAQEKLFYWVQGWLNMQTGCEERWDIYDQNRIPTGRTHRRGDFLEPGDYHLVVYIWMLNAEGKFLLTKRSPNKGFPNMWETTGGSAVTGDDSLSAALREVREETGLILDPEKGRCVLTYTGKDYFADVWLFYQDFSLEDVVLLEGETCDVGYFSKNDILQMQKDETMVPYRHLEKLFAII